MELPEETFVNCHGFSSVGETYGNLLLGSSSLRGTDGLGYSESSAVYEVVSDFIIALFPDLICQFTAIHDPRTKK
jgi:hypothetical protein